MLKNILNVSGVQELSKNDQKEFMGGVPVLIPRSCDVVCRTAPRGTDCGPSHCPGVCDGHGGYYNI
ncbi:hypothetical protein [Aquimarina rhabdastrellae]